MARFSLRENPFPVLQPIFTSAKVHWLYTQTNILTRKIKSSPVFSYRYISFLFFNHIFDRFSWFAAVIARSMKEWRIVCVLRVVIWWIILEKNLKQRRYRLQVISLNKKSTYLSNLDRDMFTQMILLTSQTDINPLLDGIPEAPFHG